MRLIYLIGYAAGYLMTCYWLGYTAGKMKRLGILRQKDKAGPLA